MIDTGFDLYNVVVSHVEETMQIYTSIIEDASQNDIMVLYHRKYFL